MEIRTRFAPSPTGPLHIGGVRTALFNWLYSKNKSGKFYLRIEDTDKERSKEEHKIQIIKSLKWMGIEHDGEEYIQSKMIEEHVNIAKRLLENGNAYKCFCSAEEIEEQKKRAKQKKIPYIYDRKWRNKNESDAPKEIDPVIRFKSKVEGKSILKDLVQGNIEIENNTIEDFVILRADGSPTYNLSASVDDHLMGMTHIIRGDDHKINTFKQIQIYEAMNWEVPFFAHIPLIHTIEGKKLSKRFNLFCKSYGKNLTLIFEPGKFLVSEAGKFICKVNSIKQTTSTVFAQVDSGFNHFLRPMMYGANHHIENISNPDDTERYYSIVGYICETDTFASNRKVSTISIGDLLCFNNAGAYCHTMSSNYNSRYRPAEVLYINNQLKLIRKRENFDDLIRNQINIFNE